MSFYEGFTLAALWIRPNEALFVRRQFNGNVATFIGIDIRCIAYHHLELN